MMINNLKTLVRLSVAEPEKGAAAVLALNPPMAARWLLMAFAVTLGVVLAYLLPAFAGRAGELPAPFTAAGVQGGMNIAAVVLVTVVGRMFGVHGRFEDSLLLVCWLQLIISFL
mgnify:FL=1